MITAKEYVDLLVGCGFEEGRCQITVDALKDDDVLGGFADFVRKRDETMMLNDEDGKGSEGWRMIKDAARGCDVFKKYVEVIVVKVEERAGTSATH